MPVSAYTEMFIKNKIPKSSSDLQGSLFFSLYSIFMMFLSPSRQMLG
jgi:hypothetical protein